MQSSVPDNEIELGNFFSNETQHLDPTMEGPIDVSLQNRIIGSSIEINRLDRLHSFSRLATERKMNSNFDSSGFLFLQAMAESMLVPMETQISPDLHITQAYQWILCNSLILIGIGLAPLILAPLSEVYGRRPILLSGSAVFVIWNTACGVAPNLAPLLAFDFSLDLVLALRMPFQAV